MLEGRGRLVAQGGTVLEKLGTLTTGTTLLARVIFYSLFLSIVGIQMTLLMHYAICDFVKK